MTTNKKYIFSEIFFKIVDIQSSYARIIKQLSKKIASFVPKDLKDYEELNILDQQVDAAERNFKSLEQVKYVISLALLTESSQATDEEMMNTINLVDDLDKIAQIEVGSEDEILRSWALSKQELWLLIRENLLAMLNYKYMRKVELGELTVQ
jgi:predicted nucleotide-binding protein (sugar kinase/HSP70/actin superfamily)